MFLPSDQLYNSAILPFFGYLYYNFLFSFPDCKITPVSVTAQSLGYSMNGSFDQRLTQTL